MTEEKKVEEKASEEKIFIDLDGKGETKSGFDKPPLIPKDSYNAVFESVNFGEFPDYNDKNKKVKKFVFQMRLEDFVHEGKEVTLPFFVRALVTKAYKPEISNSKLFDLLNMSGLMPHFHEHYTELETEPAFRSFIEGNLLGRKCRVQVSTANEKGGDAKKMYSKVADVLRFLDAAPGQPEKKDEPDAVPGVDDVPVPVEKDVTPEVQK